MRVFGTQIHDAAVGLNSKDDRVKVVMQIIVSVVLLAAGVYVILNTDYSETTQEIAAGWVGVVVGYWLK